MTKADQSILDTSVIILHGDDEQSIADMLLSMLDTLCKNNAADLDIDRLDGRTATIDQISNALMTLPFLSTYRVVILGNPLARMNEAKSQEWFLSQLGNLPKPTRLILVVEDTVDKKTKWKILRSSHWLTKWIEEKDESKDNQKEKTSRKLYDFPKPTQRSMSEWIRKHAVSLGGKFSKDAADMLAEYVGNDTRFAHQEILKLLTYVLNEREVQAEDVENLSIPGSKQDVFTMVDALTEGDAKKATHQLHGLLETDEPNILFGMIVRQFRLLLQAREMMDLGKTHHDVAKRLAIHPFVAEKLCKQAKRYKIETLEDHYRRLLEMDISVKTGGTESDLAMDMLIMDLAKNQ